MAVALNTDVRSRTRAIPIPSSQRKSSKLPYPKRGDGEGGCGSANEADGDAIVDAADEKAHRDTVFASEEKDKLRGVAKVELTYGIAAA
jgi:hypothetical protein